MADRQVEHLVTQLTATATTMMVLASQVADLHAVAYERTVTGGEPVDGHPWPPPGVEHHGNEHGRELWHRLEAAVTPVEKRMQSIHWAIGNLLSDGASPEEMRGWREQIQRKEAREALRQQKLRAERGEYVPTRMVDQPPYPGTVAK